jgi:hypothetical protein
MTRNFFRSLEEKSVSYLLISGQASVLYQAADFSEDVDLWVEPTLPNIERLFSALRDCKARYYKLTPPLTEANLQAGHGFHFIVEGDSPFYLDIMGQPPRVHSFAEAHSRRQLFETDWGLLPVMGLKDLVEVKKTQRLRDYGIIGGLARRWIDRPEFTSTPAEFTWVMENLFSLTDFEALAVEHPEAADQWSDPDLKTFVQSTANGRDIPADLEDRIQRSLQDKISTLQRADRDYWKKIISQLREFKTNGQLQREGDTV